MIGMDLAALVGGALQNAKERYGSVDELGLNGQRLEMQYGFHAAQAAVGSKPSLRQLEDMANSFRAIVDYEAGVYDVLRGTPTSSTWRCSWCGGANEAKAHSCPGCGAAVGT